MAETTFNVVLVHTYLSKVWNHLIPNVATTKVMTAETMIPTMTVMPCPLTAVRMSPAIRESTKPYPTLITMPNSTQILEGQYPIVYRATTRVRSPVMGPKVEMYPVQTDPNMVPNAQQLEKQIT